MYVYHLYVSMFVCTYGMYVCLYVLLYVLMYVFEDVQYVCGDICTSYVSGGVCMCAGLLYICVCVCMCVGVYLCVWGCFYVCGVYVCVWGCMYVCVGVYVYVWIYEGEEPFKFMNAGG